jgi:UDPglucose 6-dehydrogenase
MIKYASNAFLATKISFINEIANICEELGADVKEVAVGMGYDQRIGPFFLDAGLGYGGSCFPKDVKALAYMAAEKGRHPQLLHAVMEINDDRRSMAVARIEEMLGDVDQHTIGILGLSFKPNTDDMRDAPSIDIANALLEIGAKVRAYDPVAMDIAAPMLPDVTMASDPYLMAVGCDALIVLTDWNEFKHLDFERIRDVMNQPVLFDGRNIYDPEIMLQLGFNYCGVGRGYNDAHINEQVEHEIITPTI